VAVCPTWIAVGTSDTVSADRTGVGGGVAVSPPEQPIAASAAKTPTDDALNAVFFTFVSLRVPPENAKH
jgi:hypothetical protein